jgi:hypothetical protein
LAEKSPGGGWGFFVFLRAFLKGVFGKRVFLMWFLGGEIVVDWW